MATIQDLKTRLASLKAKSITLSAEEAEEAKLRADCAAEEARIREEAAVKRRLDNDRILESARAKAGADAICELVDLETAGVYVVRNPPTLCAESLQKAIREKKSADALDITNFVIGSLVYPDPYVGDTGVELRARFDLYPFATQTLSNVALRLGGLKTEEERRKS